MIPGTLFANRYRIVRRLGTGGMGTVYEVVDAQTQSARALKVMPSQVLDRDDLRARFRTEATVAGSVGSPFLVDVIDAGVDEATATPYLVMELLRGEDLGQRLKRSGALPPAEALALLAQLAKGLDAMHRAGVVHRDLKPSNLFIEARPHEPSRVKILDFGIAKILEVGGTQGSTATVGTPLYMAPEQFRGCGVTAETDIHALGMIAFTMLTGSPYWVEPGGAPLHPVAFALLVSEGPSEAASVRAARRGVELPGAFDDWFRRATAVAPRCRFRSASEAVKALAGVFGREAPPSRRPAPPPVATAPSDVAPFAETLPLGEETPPEGVASARKKINRALAIGPRTVGAVGPVGRAVPGGRWSAFLASTLAGVAAAIAAAWWATSHPAEAPRAPSPLASAGSVLACPPARVFGVGERSGWLGAAAAATLCERARVVLGGTPARTLLPAELLSLPPQPVDGYAADPYDAEDARGRALEAARRRAAAYVDGTLTRAPAGYRLVVSLRRSGDDTEFARSAAESSALYDVVRRAMAPWVAAGSLPRAARLDPTVAEYTGAPTIDDALLLLDLSLAMTHNAGTLPEECRRLESRADALGVMGAGERRRCAYTFGWPEPTIALPPPSPSSRGAAAAHARIVHNFERVDPPAVIARLSEDLRAEPSPWGRSTLASTLSCLLQASDAERADELALLAVQAEPKNPTGEWCAPWVQLATVREGTTRGVDAARAMQAWSPWDGYGWLFEGQATPDPTRALDALRRAYLLSPFDTNVASKLSDKLLAAGRREEVRGIALALAAGGQPVHEVASELLLLRVEASEARFGAALRRALEAMAPRAADVGWVRAQRLEIAWHALELAAILGRSAEVADRVASEFIDPEPPPLDLAHPDVSKRLPAMCARTSAAVSGRCFDRFREIRQRLSGGVLPGAEAFVAGAEKSARRDLRGAAKAFRPLLREPAPFVTVLPEAMIEAFEAAREPEAVTALEAALPDRAAELGGASLVMVWAARRAAREGRAAAARELADRVISAWSTADEAVPAVDEMRRLKAQVP
ncbi:MAG TPA: serine/threonine-protein kinase [Polyangiaceae bacterium]|nr:serine/threonine-protein kinase [Polyangiaceae bacterium]